MVATGGATITMLRCANRPTECNRLPHMCVCMRAVCVCDGDRSFADGCIACIGMRARILLCDLQLGTRPAFFVFV